MMSTIDSIQGGNAASVLYNTAQSGSSSSAAAKFSTMLSNMQQGAPATGYGDTDANSDDQIVTTTQVMTDGSVMVTVTDMTLGKVLSQTKSRPTHTDGEKSGFLDSKSEMQYGAVQHDRSVKSPDSEAAQAEAAAGSMQQGLWQSQMDRFNDTSSSMGSVTGSLFQAGV